MPKKLRNAHQKLDDAVDNCYRKAAFKSDREHMEFLFERYVALTSLFATTVKQKKARGKKT